MTKLIQRERRHLEIAFESSIAIVKLAGAQDSEELTRLSKLIIEGKLTFDDAVQIVITGCTVALPIKK